MKIGYVRVSTKEQNTARQEELMESLGVNVRVYLGEKDITRAVKTEADMYFARVMNKCLIFFLT